MYKVFLYEIDPEELAERIAQRFMEKIKDVLPEGEKADEYLTSKEVSKRLKISLPTLNEYCKRGLIPSYRMGRSVRYKLSDIENVLNKGLRYAIRKGGGL